MSVQLDKQKIHNLREQAHLSQNGLALTIGVQRGSLSNALSGKRGAGIKIVSGLLKQFPNENIDSLTMKAGGGDG